MVVVRIEQSCLEKNPNGLEKETPYDPPSPLGAASFRRALNPWTLGFDLMPNARVRHW
jgi:hypothetical protein